MISQIPFYFSVAGARPGDVAALVPTTTIALDPYNWGHVPYIFAGYASQVQILNVCNGSTGENWCWITNETRWDSGRDLWVRSNLAAISSPQWQPPVASGGQYNSYTRIKYAMDAELPDKPTTWVSGQTTDVMPGQFITVDLHPVDVDAVTIAWHPDAQIIVPTGGTSVTLAVAHPQVYTVVLQTNDSWYTYTRYLVALPHSRTDTFTITPPITQVEAMRLKMDQPTITGHYAIRDLGVYGQVQEQLFQPQHPTNPAARPLSDWVAEHPGLTWLMANEPDNYDLVHGDGIPPDDYGRFYAQVATLIRDADETAKIVFCQGTVAGAVTNDTDDQFPHGRGPAYCAQAVTQTIAALSANNSPYTLTALVDAVSTHQYINTTITVANLAMELDNWKVKLADFREWVNSVPALAYKPLYLTEYGNSKNPCPDGSPNEETPNDRCGDKVLDGHAFWGAHYREGFWAIIYHTTDYFLSPENQGGQWRAAWWFFFSGVRADAVKGNLGTRDDEGVVPNPNGTHYTNAINCLALGIPLSCPDMEE